ncbi:hypothetical protein HMPREF1981_02504 [Bacteroides pyogenes F0041]|uniref:Uncharacterized protein n=1 Tax=Bacteroides pyogenes F0041 TaxID=1321819 RepID=U2DWD5_9BACE|nr:hypothetical protein HMPREF1981_02504 [Bacteroides pyogenes F0041]
MIGGRKYTEDDESGSRTSMKRESPERREKGIHLSSETPEKQRARA